MNEVKNPFPTMFSVRLSQEETDYVNENLHLLRGDDDNMPRSKVFINAIAKAISNVKPKEIVRDNPEQLKEIEQLKQQVQSLAQQNQGLIDKINELQAEDEQSIKLKLHENYKNYFWGMLEISKKKGYASSYEELFEKMLLKFHERGEFILDQNDINYLNQLKQQQKI